MRLAALFAVLPLIMVLSIILFDGGKPAVRESQSLPGLALQGKGYRISDGSHRTHGYDGSDFGPGY